jgi:4-coumarate--CoA ligase
LNTHPGIVESAVVGVPDGLQDGNDLPRAYIVRRNIDLTEREVKEFVIKYACSHWELRGGVRFVDSIAKVT